MKIRTGFVSNSSSSSFIVIDAKRGRTYPKLDHLIVDRSLGEVEFGWGPERIDGWGSRVIFSYLQTLYSKNDQWLEMLEDVIKSESGAKSIEWGVSLDYDAYIDHQSCASEGENTEMFDSPDDLRDFLFGNDSYIQLDNDNS